MFMSDIFPMVDKFSLITQGRGADVDLGVFFRELPLLLERLRFMVEHPEEGRKSNEHFGARGSAEGVDDERGGRWSWVRHQEPWRRRPR